MNWQLFFSTFVLIFLAELGDKTQLAVMAQSAGSSFKWLIFFAGSLALVLATAIGVLAGGVLRRFIQDMSIIRICGGIMFLIFGVLMLVDGIRSRRERAVEKEIPALTGWMSRHVIQHAAAFEEAAAAKYKELAAKEQDKEKRELYLWLAKEEGAHLNAMKAGLLVSDEDDYISVTEEIAGDMPPVSKMLMEGGENGRSALDELQEAVECEMAQVQFYEALAKHCKIPRLKDTFHALASAEQLHVDKLRGVLGDNTYGRLD